LELYLKTGYMSLFNCKNCSSGFHSNSGLVLNKYNVDRKKQKGTNIIYNEVQYNESQNTTKFTG